MSDADEKRMNLRYAGTCRVCDAVLEARVEAIYERTTKTVRCLDCSPAVPVVEVRAKRASKPPTDPVDPGTPGAVPVVEVRAKRASKPPTDPIDVGTPGAVPVVEVRAERASKPPIDPVDPGTPGASARREYERRRTKRQTRIREKHPKLGGVILAMTGDPQSTTAWNTGALGEERLGERLNELSSDTLRVLHDRRIPGSRANIDHIAVTPTGVYVIDAKRYKGRPSLKVEGGIVRPRVEKLLVGSRDQTKLVDGAIKQVDVIRAIVGDAIPVTGVLCFVEADWPYIGGAFTTRGIEVLRPKKLYPRLVADGRVAADVGDLHRRLASALPPA